MATYGYSPDCCPECGQDIERGYLHEHDCPEDPSPTCYACARPVDACARALVTVDLDPGNPEVGPQPWVMTVVAHADCADRARALMRGDDEGEAR